LIINILNFEGRGSPKRKKRREDFELWSTVNKKEGKTKKTNIKEYNGRREYHHMV
jgi:hypothetical protein